MKYNKLPKNEQNLQYIREGQIDKLIKANTYYIYKFVSKLPIDDTSIKQDLVQEGRIGIYKASQTFNPEDGTPFIAYARNYIKKEIFRYLEKYQNTIKIPSRIFWDSDNHIKTISTAIQLNDDTSSTVEDLLEDKVEDNEIDDNQYFKNKAILMRFNELKPQQRYIVSNYLGLDAEKGSMTLKEIADELGITRQAVQEQYHTAIKKMRNKEGQPKATLFCS